MYLQKRNGLKDFKNKFTVYQVGKGGEQGDGLGLGFWHIHTIMYGMDGQQGLAVQHREQLYPIFHNNLYGKRIGKRKDMCICITESLRCIAEIITL